MNAGFAHGVTIRHRDELDAVQRELREIPGLTVLVYDQTCAAEKRRRRKRGTFPDPAKRVFINDAVCEGCGDCSDKSNCVSVKPLETELGRKRQIDQSNCNKDFSCLNGFCPSFVTVHGGTPAKAKRPQLKVVEKDPFESLPMPTLRPLNEAYGILVTGIGGTGVITVGALIGMAAHLEGKGCTVLDFTGLAQKNGAVMSHIRLAPKPEDLHAVRIAAGGANLVLGCDMVVAAAPAALSRIEPGITKAVINGYMQPVAAFVLNGDMDLGAESMMKSIRDAAGDDATTFVDGTGLATAIFGDSIATNLFMLGYAWQKGLVPLSLDALNRAIELNGVAVETSKRTFAWGRLAAHNLARRAGGGQADPAGREDRGAHPEGDRRQAGRAADRLSGQGLCRPLQPLHRAGRDGREGARPGPLRPRRGGRQVALQADGLQGRVRGRAALHRRRVPEEARRAVRGRLQALLPSRAAAVRRSRSDDRPAQEARVRRLDAERVPRARRPQAAARHRASTSSATPRSARWSAA